MTTCLRIFPDFGCPIAMLSWKRFPKPGVGKMDKKVLRKMYAAGELT